MASIALKVIRPPLGSAVPAPPPTATPLFRGTGGTDYVCGHCAAVIALGMGPAQHVIVDTTVCSCCGAENEFPRDLRA